MVPVIPPAVSAAGGGVSGAPLRQRAVRLLRRVVEAADQRVPVISSGGVMNPEDVWQRLLLGASMVQIYSGLIYYGPAIVKDTEKYLRNKMREYGCLNLSDLQKNQSRILKSETEKAVQAG